MMVDMIILLFRFLSGALSDPLALELSRERVADKINC